jgi:hypothetical protein
MEAGREKNRKKGRQKKKKKNLRIGLQCSLPTRASLDNSQHTFSILGSEWQSDQRATVHQNAKN